MAVLGIDLGGGHIRVGRVSHGRASKVRTAVLKSTAGKHELIRQITGAIDLCFDASVKGIGMGVPSFVQNGVVFDPGNIPAFQDIPLKRILERRYKVPAAIDNDANCFALGAAPKNGIAVGLILGTGVGSGVVANGKLISGRHAGTGEFGRIPYREKTIEEYCSGKFFIRKRTTGERDHRRARQGNRAALRRFDSFGKHLAKLIAIIVHSLDPDVIVLGGGVSRSLCFFRAPMKAELKKLISRRAFRDLKIVKAGNSRAAVIGAARLCPPGAAA